MTDALQNPRGEHYHKVFHKTTVSLDYRSDFERGTLRYNGFPEFVQCLMDIGFIDEKEVDVLKPSDTPVAWKEATAKVLGATSSAEE